MFVSYKQSRLFWAKRLNLWNDFLLPVWSDALTDHFQRFSFRHLFMLLRIQAFVHLLKPWVRRIIELNHWRGIIIRLPPQLHLFLTIFHSSFLFAVTLQSPIMSFIYFPRLNCFDMILNAHFLTDQIQSFCGSNQAWSKCKLEVKSKIFKLFSCQLSFFNAYVIERDINPSTKSSCFVPNRLPMPNKYNFVRRLL